MKKTILVLGAMLIVSISFSNLTAQDANILIGLDSPSYGVKIKTNFPGRTSTWARGFILSNENNTEDFAWFGSFGSVLDGKSSLGYSFIGKAYNKTYIAFRPDGNVGIGTTTPEVKLDIKGSVQLPSGGNGFAFLKFKYNSSDNSSRSWYIANDLFNWGDFGIYQSTNQTDNDLSKIVYNHRFYINKIGNVGIGTTNPKYLLSVKGKIGVGEIVVEDVSQWADFVFNSDYRLMPLAEVESFIQENNHLPDVPSETEVKEKGINVAEMNAKLLQKIEELTLYMIEMKKENDEMKKRLEIVERR